MEKQNVALAIVSVLVVLGIVYMMYTADIDGYAKTGLFVVALIAVSAIARPDKSS